MPAWIEEIRKDSTPLRYSNDIRLREAGSDITKLIQAVSFAENVLDFIANGESYIDLEFRGPEFQRKARKALAQLQSGEFGEGESDG